MPSLKKIDKGGAFGDVLLSAPAHGGDMSRCFSLAAFSLACLLLSACGTTAGSAAAPPADAAAALDVAAADVSSLPITASDKGTFAAQFERTPEPPTPSGNVLTMILMDTAGAPLAGATIKATPWMPAMGHGSPKTPVVKDDGGGHYTISNLLFTMLGKWELRIDVTADAGQDRFTLVYQIK